MAGGRRSDLWCRPTGQDLLLWYPKEWWSRQGGLPRLLPRRARSGNGEDCRCRRARSRMHRRPLCSVVDRLALRLPTSLEIVSCHFPETSRFEKLIGGLLKAIFYFYRINRQVSLIRYKKPPYHLILII